MTSSTTTTVATELYPQRWACLASMILVLFVLQFSLIIVPGVAVTIMPEMGLTPAELGMLANMPYLTGVVLCVVTGNLGDRFGIKKCMTIALIFFALGAWWRAYADTFVTLMISSFVMGAGLATLNSNSTKSIRLWFPGNTMGPIMGLYVAGASIGAGIALKCGPLWGTHLSFIICAAASIVALLAWVLFYKTHPEENTKASESFNKKTLLAIIKNKDVWIVSVFILFVFGNSTTFQTYLNASLAIPANGDMNLVGTISLVSTIVVCLSSILMPAFVARFKSFRPVMAVTCLLWAIFTAIFLLVPFGPLTWVVLVLEAITLGCALAMGKSVPALLPGIDPRNLGAVGGVQATFQNIGGWLIAGYIIAPIAQGVYPSLDGGITYGFDCYIAIYFGAAICCLVVLICTLLLPKDTPTKLDIIGSGEQDRITIESSSQSA